jgi:[ribosomal protein S5]-alanine N-acetyltransferase
LGPEPVRRNGGWRDAGPADGAAAPGGVAGGITPDPDLHGDLAIAVGDFDLRPLDETDTRDLLAHFNDPAVVEYMDIEPLTQIEVAEAIVAWAKGRRALGAGARWAIRERSSGAFAGTCGFNCLTVERGRRGEIAYDLGAAWWGKGVMSQILPVMINFGLGRLGLHRLEAMVTPGNERSCRLLERHGFAREGLLRGYGFWKGQYWDQIVYARLSAQGDSP